MYITLDELYNSFTPKGKLIIAVERSNNESMMTLSLSSTEGLVKGKIIVTDGDYDTGDDIYIAKEFLNWLNTRVDIEDSDKYDYYAINTDHIMMIKPNKE